jgi:hypothetical protein
LRWIIGAVAGIMPAHQAASLVDVLVFALCVFIGYSVGRDLGFKYKPEAQLALCRVQTEVNARPAVGARAVA